MKVFEKVYQVVRQIPPGKVATYGQIARMIGTTPRVVGYALHANKDRSTPCHRVVDRNGRLAPNFAFGGNEEQFRLLESEGISFIDKNHVRLAEHLLDTVR